MNRSLKNMNAPMPDEREHLNRRHQERLGQLKNANATVHDLAWDIEEIEQRLLSLMALREGPTDILMEREIHDLSRRKADLEDQMLREMLHTDELAAQVADLQQALKRHRSSE